MVAVTAAENELAEQMKKEEDTKIFKSDNTNPSKNTSELSKLSTTNTGVDSQQVRTKPVSTHDASSAVASSVEPVATTAPLHADTAERYEAQYWNGSGNGFV